MSVDGITDANARLEISNLIQSITELKALVSILTTRIVKLENP